MNCLEGRRLLLAAPREAQAGLKAHLAECEDCSRLLSEITRLDRQIEEAARAPAPEGIAERLLLRHQRRAWF